jgi:hypothetical protein
MPVAFVASEIHTLSLFSLLLGTPGRGLGPADNEDSPRDNRLGRSQHGAWKLGNKS